MERHAVFCCKGKERKENKERDSDGTQKDDKKKNTSRSIYLFIKIVEKAREAEQNKKKRTEQNNGHHYYLKEKHFRKNGRFQLRPLHTRHAVTCTPTMKDAKNKGLQNCLGDLVL